MHRLLRHPFLRFVLVGLSNTAVGFGTTWAALRLFGWGDAAANAIGYAIGFLWGFTWHRIWTFRHRGAVEQGLLRYGAVCAVAYAANLAVVLEVSRLLGSGQLLTQACGMVTYTTLAYAGARLYAFRAPAAT
ncbi:hypothetical protein BKK79_06080 [Cupriavidus sp. USMAA2-4]|uniref:GtrA/DPMS transmembrane domain-containing protein n=1 Tax=Cupriavidus malaysiensis TaxID=367825 RepID=A0ABN4TJA7_9BURK|nr:MULTISPECIES: GtrA family protein [Cupriavidus]AOY91433.1 hypothetical protein BKK79_06080 [Cupriavidus sp. USMAA2-4]AOY98998.1 hypothetical protein BKK81_06785 [Cupriavidus sp. USMAHM13]AOZ05420.1 hypothetical protein BKK80_06075 [Cupriavidus malaysiensis]